MHKRNEMMTLLNRVENLSDPYDILNLPKSATDDAIKKRYRELNKKYHPDLFTATDEVDNTETTQAAQRLLKIIFDAYNKIKSQENRDKYASEKVHDQGVELATLFTIERNIQKAAKHIDYGRYNEAQSILKEAKKHDPKNEEIKAYLEYLAFLELPVDKVSNKRSNSEAKRVVEQFATTEEKHDCVLPYALLIARVQKIQGKHKEAIAAYTRVSEHTNAKHDEAERELRLLKKRRQNPSPPPTEAGLLERIKAFFKITD